MKNRPWPLMLLALGSFISPLSNSILNAWIEKRNVVEYVTHFFNNRSWLAIFEYFIVDPVAGIAIWTMKLWVYPFFLALQIYTLSKNIFVWLTDYHDRTSVFLLVAVCLINIAVVTYYLLPQVRVFFFNRRMRWWEAAPRFRLGVTGEIKLPTGAMQTVRIADVSDGGFFAEDGPTDIKMGDKIEVTFSILGVAYLLRGSVVHTGKGGPGNFGVQFDRFEPEIADQLCTLIKALKILGQATTRNSDVSFKQFLLWLKRLLTTGKGLVPEVKLPPKQ